MFTEAQMREALDKQGFVYEHTNEARLSPTHDHLLDDQRVARAIFKKGHIPGKRMRLAKLVAEITGVSPELMVSSAQSIRVVKAKRLFIWAMRRMHESSTPEIAGVMGVDHSTVIHHLKVFDKKIEENAEQRDRILREYVL